jgi:hypothetical protein
MDVLGLSLVTIGPKASVETQRLFEGGEYTRYLYLHGLSVETAEALAEFHHKKMREELGIAAEDSPHIRDLFHQKYRGSRYSFGYPACPNLEDQTKLFALLKPEENVGVRLTSGFLLEPEQSTSAIVVHHPGRSILWCVSRDCQFCSQPLGSQQPNLFALSLRLFRLVRPERALDHAVDRCGAQPGRGFPQSAAPPTSHQRPVNRLIQPSLRG